MQSVTPLAHGALGIWDEIVPVILLIGIGVIALISGILSRRRDESLTKPTNNPDDKESSERDPRADHYRLD